MALIYGAPDNHVVHGVDFANWSPNVGSSVGANGVTVGFNSYAQIYISGLQPSTSYWCRCIIAATSGTPGNLRISADNSVPEIRNVGGGNFDLPSGIATRFFRLQTSANSGPHRLRVAHNGGTAGATIRFSEFNVYPIPTSNGGVAVLGDRCGSFVPATGAGVDTAITNIDSPQIRNLVSSGDQADTTYTYDQTDGTIWSVINSRGGSIYACMGNHDYDVNRETEWFQFFGTFNGTRRYYSRVLGNTEYFILDTTSTNGGIGGISNATAADFEASTQGVWLRNALAASTAKWHVVVQHYPPYSSSSSGQFPQLRLNYSSGSYPVHVMVQGHDHSIERLRVDRTYFLTCAMAGDGHHGWGAVVPQTEWRENDTTISGYFRLSDSPSSFVIEFFGTNNVLRDRTLIFDDAASGTQLAAGGTIDVQSSILSSAAYGAAGAGSVMSGAAVQAYPFPMYQAYGSAHGFAVVSNGSTDITTGLSGQAVGQSTVVCTTTYASYLMSGTAVGKAGMLRAGAQVRSQPRLVADDRLRAEVLRGHWKFEVYDNHEQPAYKSRTVMPGDGVDDIDRVFNWMLKHPAGQVHLINVNSGDDKVSTSDVVFMRKAFVDAYGERAKINEYTPLPPDEAAQTLNHYSLSAQCLVESTVSGSATALRSIEGASSFVDDGSYGPTGIITYYSDGINLPEENGSSLGDLVWPVDSTFVSGNALINARLKAFVTDGVGRLEFDGSIKTDPTPYDGQLASYVVLNFTVPVRVTWGGTATFAQSEDLNTYASVGIFDDPYTTDFAFESIDESGTFTGGSVDLAPGTYYFSFAAYSYYGLKPASCLLFYEIAVI